MYVIKSITLNRCFKFSVAAKDKHFLRRMGINYVLNTAEGKRYTQVDTDHIYYRDCPGLRYKGFQLMDLPSTDISKYFYIAANFIDEAVSSGGIFQLYFITFFCIQLASKIYI